MNTNNTLGQMIEKTINNLSDERYMTLRRKAITAGYYGVADIILAICEAGDITPSEAVDLI